MRKFQGSKEGNTVLTSGQQLELANKLLKNKLNNLTGIVEDFLTEQEIQYEFGNTRAGKWAEIRYILGFEFEDLKTDNNRNMIIENTTFLEWAKSILQKTKKDIEQTLNITRSYWNKLEGRDGGFDNNKNLIDHFCQHSPINRTTELLQTLQKQGPVTGLVTGHGRDKNQHKYLTILLGADNRGQKFYSRCYIKERDEHSPLTIEYGKRVDDDIIGLVVPCAVIDIKKNSYYPQDLCITYRNTQI